MAGRELLKHIPQVDRLLSSDEFQPLVETHSRPLVVRHVQHHLDELRRRALEDSLAKSDLEPESIHTNVSASLDHSSVPYYQRVINATGVVLHTGLGRAPLAESVAQALAERVCKPLRVEIDLESGERGGRDEGCAALLRELTGAQAATVVNNNAGATLLILAALARNKKVLLSRGEMVEIGGSYRVPDIMEEGGAVLVDVGTTNRTHAKDYERAVDEDTGMILKVHTSNYRVEGFTSEVEIEDLVAIGRTRGVPVVHDLGSGCLINLERRGLAEEPHVLRSVAAGADLICFSGDKLVGGPQCGIIIGKKDSVDQCRRHPLFRALRPGRLTYVALESTLRIYQRGEKEVLDSIPSMGRLLADPMELKKRARRLAKRLKGVAKGVSAEAAEGFSQAGSGSLPARDLPTWTVQLKVEDTSGRFQTATEIAYFLRTGSPPILPRVRDDAVILDVRTIEDSEFASIRERLAEAQSA